jgi:hypothetical protein
VNYLVEMPTTIARRHTAGNVSQALELRAQNNGRSTDNDRPKMPLDRSLYYLTGPPFWTGHIFMPSNVIADVLNLNMKL